MSNFVNKHGQPPSPPLPADHPLTMATIHSHKGPRIMPPMWMQRLGRDPIDTKTCQAPIFGAHNHMTGTRCQEPAAFVLVEDKPRKDGSIGAHSVCKHHAGMLRPEHGHLTPLTP